MLNTPPELVRAKGRFDEKRFNSPDVISTKLVNVTLSAETNNNDYAFNKSAHVKDGTNVGSQNEDVQNVDVQNLDAPSRKVSTPEINKASSIHSFETSEWFSVRLFIITYAQLILFMMQIRKINGCSSAGRMCFEWPTPFIFWVVVNMFKSNAKDVELNSQVKAMAHTSRQMLVLEPISERINLLKQQPTMMVNGIR